MTQPDYQKVADNFEKQTGKKTGRDLFEPDTTTRLMSEEYPLSVERYVTVEHEAYSLVAFGDEAHIHVRVWKDARLFATVFLQVRDILAAQAGDHERQAKWPEDRYVAARWSKDGRWVKLVEFDRRGKGPRQNEHGVKLKRAELNMLAERLAPLRGFKRLAGV